MATAQPLEPVQWSSSVKSLGDSQYEIIFKATIEQDWHIYDMGPYEVGGPMATSFTCEDLKGAEFVGNAKPSKEAVRQFNDIYEMEIGYYEGEVTFTQQVKAESAVTLDVTVDWMACNESNCITGSNDFEVKLGQTAAAGDVKVDEPAKSGSSIWGYIQRNRLGIDCSAHTLCLPYDSYDCVVLLEGFG
jgi:thiol:disulfide interchange protein DsbD